MEEIHTYYMEANCDIDDLEKVLKREKQRWTHLEDLAVVSDPGTQEYEVLMLEKGNVELEKRKRFLEYD